MKDEEYIQAALDEQSICSRKSLPLADACNSSIFGYLACIQTINFIYPQPDLGKIWCFNNF